MKNTNNMKILKDQFDGLTDEQISEILNSAKLKADEFKKQNESKSVFNFSGNWEYSINDAHVCVEINKDSPTALIKIQDGCSNQEFSLNKNIFLALINTINQIELHDEENETSALTDWLEKCGIKSEFARPFGNMWTTIETSFTRK